MIDAVSADPGRIDVGQGVVLDVTATDPDGDALSYSWTSSCSGSFSVPGAQAPTFTLSVSPAVPACTFSVVVGDGKQGTSSGDITIPAGPAPAADYPPEVAATYQSADSVAAGGTVTLRIQAVDPNGTATTFAWSVSDGILGQPLNGAGSSEVVWTAPNTFASVVTVSVTVTDSTGQSIVHSFAVRPATASWHRTPIAGIVAGAEPSSIWASSPDDVYVTATVPGDIPNGQILHWDGSTWASVLSLPGHSALKIYGASATDVWALAHKAAAGNDAGYGNDPGGRIFPSVDGGKTWVPQTLPEVATGKWLYAIAGTPGNIHVSVEGGTIIRFDGAAWTPIFKAIDGIPTLTFLSSGEGYYTWCWGWGSWDGTSWSYHGHQFDFCDVVSIWGMRDQSGALQLYTVGANNFANGVRVWKYDPTTQSFGSKSGHVFGEGNGYLIGHAMGIWGSSVSDVYVTGGFWGSEPAASCGRVYHFDGSAWSRITAFGDIAKATAVWGTGPDDVWVTLGDGTALHLGY